MAALVERTGHLAEVVRPGRFRALVVLSDATWRESVARGLHPLGAVDVAQAASVDEARVRAHAGGPRDLVITEATLPDGSGVVLLAELRSAGLAHGLLLSSLEDPYTVRAALTAGVRCLVVHRGVRDGGHGWPRAVGVEPVVAGRANGIETLSAREIEVLELVAGGRSNRDIGEALGLSALTVKSHLARIARKLGTGDRAEMVLLALRAGVID